MARPAVVFVNKFVYEWHVGAMDYSDYINRASAQIPLLKPDDNQDDYYGYMSRTAAQQYSDTANTQYTTIFDSENDFLTKEQLDHYRKLEMQSQSEGCPKYIPVMSFDNQFLMNNGLMFGGRVDTQRLKDISRKAINSLIDKSEKLDAKNVYWTADIHVNTDNVHVHFSLLEYHRNVDRKKEFARNGKDMIETSAFEQFKSTVANSIIADKRTPELTKYKRENLIPEFASSVAASKELLDLMNKLPPPKPKVGWQYGRKEMIPFHKDINKCVDKIISSNEKLKETFDNYSEMLSALNMQYISFYGNRVDTSKLSYTENQLNDFYSRAGNSLLKQLHKLYSQMTPGAPVVSEKGEKEDVLRKASDYERSHNYSDAIALLKSVEKPDDRIKLSLGRASLNSDKLSDVKDGLTLLNDLSKRKNSTADEYNVSVFANTILGHWHFSKGDFKKAKKHLLFAADKDDAYAQYDLCKLYLSVSPPDKDRSLQWLVRSADNGNSDAQSALGILLSKSPDKERAVHYLMLADASGNSAAHSMIERFEKMGKKPVSEKGEKEQKLGIHQPRHYNTKSNQSLKRIRSYQSRRATISARHQMSLCWSSIRRLIEEYERHVKELQREFEEMNNVAEYNAEYVDFGNDFGNVYSGYSL